jgi:hypothetical protein
MSRHRSPQKTKGFAYEVGQRVEELRLQLGPPRVHQDVVADALGISRAGYSERCSNNGNQWHLDELPAVRAYFEKMTGESLPGWPVLSLPESKALAAVLKIARASGPFVDGGPGAQPPRTMDLTEELRAFSVVDKPGPHAPKGLPRVVADSDGSIAAAVRALLRQKK